MTHRFRAMGCMIAVGLGDELGEPHLAHVRRIFDEDERRFTRFAADSELLRVNRARGPVLVSEPFALAVAAALRAARATDGLVDPTLLDALEGAGYDRDFDELGSDPRPARAGARGRAAQIRLNGRLLELPASTRLDLNGVVKSMAVDAALAALGGRGWVSAGGDVATGRPLDVALPGGGSVRLERGGLATSGSSARHWLRADHMQHHLIDPRTGRPADSPWAQVTVCGADCLDADIAAKAAFLRGDAGPAWLDARGMAGRFLRPGGAVVVNSVWAAAVASGREAVCT